MDTEATVHQPPPPRSLVRKLAEIMGEVDRVEKNGKNQSQGYEYATEADIAAAVRKSMAKRAVILIPTVLETTWETIPTRNGGTLRLCTLKVKFTLEDGESGETREYVIMGQGTDNGDKASYKAMTGAEKYALMKLFLIPTGDDPERDDPPPRQAQRQAPQLPQQQESKSAAKPAVPKEAAVKQDAQAALRSRKSRLWMKAKAGGATESTFQAWASEVLGRQSPSVQWTAEDVSKLEKALEESAAKAGEVG